MKSALPSFSNRPILAYVIEVDGKPEFNTHAYHIDDNDNMVYDEIPIGIIPESCEAKLEYDKENDKTYCVVNGYIFEEYSSVAIEILEREGECPVSVELSVRELSYDSKEKLLNIDDFFFSGVTVLGKNEDGEDVKPGMVGSNIKLSDFSAENNSFTFNKNDLIDEITSAVLERISNNKNQRKEETVGMDFEEKIDDVTEEEVKVTEEEATEEETPAAEETSEEVVDESGDETPEEVVEDFADDDPEESGDDDTEDDTQDGASNEAEEEVVIDDDTLPKKKYSINGMEFEVSLSDIQNAIFELVNNTYSESDNDYYMVEVYEGSKSVVMSGMWSGKSYKQSYKVRSGVYSLVGDRIPVKAVYLTADEEAELDKMRSNYSDIESKLAKYEDEPKKLEILNSDDYASIANTAEFEELKKEQNHFDLTVGEVREKADELLLNFAKSGKLNFESKPEKKNVGVGHFAHKTQDKNGRYGKLFRK